MKLLVLLAFAGLVSMCQSRHIHPGSKIENKIIFEDLNIDEDPVGNLYLKPTRFVPINSESFFKSYEPCQDGYKRDVLGICREVWD